MVILGIDPGLANTGWGVVESRGSQCRARAYGCIHTEKSQGMPHRLKTIHDEIAAVIARYSPQEVAIEEIFFCSNAQSAIATAQARGAALVACASCGLEIGEYTPMQIKQAVAGSYLQSMGLLFETPAAPAQAALPPAQQAEEVPPYEDEGYEAPPPPEDYEEPDTGWQGPYYEEPPVPR